MEADRWQWRIMNYCRCGRPYQTTGDCIPLQQIVLSDGTPVYEVCGHGVIVLDDRWQFPKLRLCEEEP